MPAAHTSKTPAGVPNAWQFPGAVAIVVSALLIARFYDARWYLRRRSRLLIALRVFFTSILFAALTLAALDKVHVAPPFTRGGRPAMNYTLYTLCVVARSLILRVDFRSALLLQALDCAAMGTAFRISGWPPAASAFSPGVFWSTMLSVYVALPAAITSAVDAWNDRRLAAARAREMAAAAAAAAAARAAEDAAPKNAAPPSSTVAGAAISSGEIGRAVKRGDSAHERAPARASAPSSFESERGA